MTQFLKDRNEYDKNTSWTSQYAQLISKIEPCQDLFIPNTPEYFIEYMNSENKILIKITDIDNNEKEIKRRVIGSNYYRTGMLCLLLALEGIPDGSTVLINTPNNQVMYQVTTNIRNSLKDKQKLNPSKCANLQNKNMDLAINVAERACHIGLKFQTNPCVKALGHEFFAIQWYSELQVYDVSNIHDDALIITSDNVEPKLPTSLIRRRDRNAPYSADRATYPLSTPIIKEKSKQESVYSFSSEKSTSVDEVDGSSSKQAIEEVSERKQVKIESVNLNLKKDAADISTNVEKKSQVASSTTNGERSNLQNNSDSKKEANPESNKSKSLENEKQSIAHDSAENINQMNDGSITKQSKHCAKLLITDKLTKETRTLDFEFFIDNQQQEIEKKDRVKSSTNDLKVQDLSSHSVFEKVKEAANKQCEQYQQLRRGRPPQSTSVTESLNADSPISSVKSALKQIKQKTSKLTMSKQVSESDASDSISDPSTSESLSSKHIDGIQRKSLKIAEISMKSESKKKIYDKSIIMQNATCQTTELEQQTASKNIITTTRHFQFYSDKQALLDKIRKVLEKHVSIE